MKLNPSTRLLAGSAKADITPALGIQIAGDIGRHRPCTSLQEPLYARALILEQAGKRYCILALDVLAIDNPWADEIRRRAQAQYGLTADAVLIHITQNHGAPSIGNHFCKDSCTLIPAAYDWLRGGDARYNEPAVAGTLKAIGLALDNLTPVRVEAGRAVDGRIAFNRRFVMRTGQTLCHPPSCSPDILQNEGPVDPEVGVTTFTADDGRVVSALLHHTCHPCCGYGQTAAMADWPGAWCREMESAWGETCTPLVINGCCGNIHQHNHLDPNDKNDHLLMGRRLAESTRRALAKMTPIDASRFSWTRHVAPLPRRRVPDELLAAAKKMLSDYPEPKWKDGKHIQVDWDWVYAVGIVDIAEDRAAEPCYPYEIQAMRLGDFALLALMGEPFVEAQLKIKKDSAFPFTMVAHMCNGYLGYVPTLQAFAGGGYETRTGRGSRLVPEALEQVEAESIALLKQLH